MHNILKTVAEIQFAGSEESQARNGTFRRLPEYDLFDQPSEHPVKCHDTPHHPAFPNFISSVVVKEETASNQKQFHTLNKILECGLASHGEAEMW